MTTEEEGVAVCSIELLNLTPKDTGMLHTVTDTNIDMSPGVFSNVHRKMT